MSQNEALPYKHASRKPTDGVRQKKLNPPSDHVSQLCDPVISSSQSPCCPPPRFLDEEPSDSQIHDSLVVEHRSIQEQLASRVGVLSLTLVPTASLVGNNVCRKTGRRQLGTGSVQRNRDSAW